MDPASPSDVTSPPKQNILNAALRQEQEVGLHKGDEEQAAQVIQRYYRGYRTRRELKGWSLDSTTRWLEAIRDAQWHQAMQGQYPTGDEDNNGHPNHETDILAKQVEESEQTTQPQEKGRQSSTSLSPDVRKKWKFAGKVALRAGGDDNAQDKVAETIASSSSETQVSEEKLSGQQTTTTATSSHTFFSKTQRQPAAEVEKTAKMMDLQYFLEMVDTKHRYGSNLRAYHGVWKNGPSKQNFFYWLDYGDGKDFEIERVPRDRLDREQVRYLTREERQNYLVVVDKNGRFRWAKNDERVWTDSEQYKDSMKGVVPIKDRTPTFREYTTEGDEIFTESSSDSEDLSGSDEEDSDEEVRRYVNPDFENAKGIKKVQYVSPAVIFNQLMEKSLKKKDKWIFVADTSYRIYIGIKESGAFQHSSFLRGARISSAGLIKIKNGQLRSLSPLSGHYRPPAANFRAFVHALQQQGVDMSRVSISRSYAVLVGIEGYMKFKQKKKDVKDKLDEEKFKALNISDAEQNGNVDNNENPSRQTTQNEKISSIATNSAENRDEESSRKPRFLTGLVKTLTRKDSQPQGQGADIRGRGIPGTAPEEGVPAPAGRR